MTKLMALVLVVLMLCNLAMPTKNGGKTDVLAESSETTDVEEKVIGLKVMTFNVQHFLDYNNQVIDTELFAKVVKENKVDFCGLNEVRGDGTYEDYTDQTNALGDSLCFNRYFGEAIKVGGENPYGNAFVTKYPVISSETFIIPDPEKPKGKQKHETRCVIKTVVDVDGERVCFLVCHMGLNSDEQKNAVNTLCGIIDEINMPLILMGDFNTTPDSKVLEPIYERLEDADCKAKVPALATYPSYAPEIKIDYIFYKGLECVGSKTICNVYSDHYPIIADFEL